MTTRVVRKHTAPAAELLATEIGVECDETGTIPSAHQAMQREGTTMVICGGMFKEQLLILLQQPRYKKARSLLLQLLPWYQRLSSANLRGTVRIQAPFAGTASSPPSRAAQQTAAEELLRNSGF